MALFGGLDSMPLEELLLALKSKEGALEVWNVKGLPATTIYLKPGRIRSIDLPLLVQVLSAADMFDALTSRRTYREAVRPEEALEALEREVREGRLAREAVRALGSGLLRKASKAEGHVLHL